MHNHWKFPFLLATLFLITQGLRSQNADDEENLLDIPLSRPINEADTNLCISKFKGKIVLLDFWGLGCTYCIQHMPVLDSLQEQFAGDLKILSITRDPYEQITALFRKRKESHGISIFTNDTLLSEYFPHRSFPHYIWIDRNGIILSSSTDENVNSLTISRLIAGEKVEFTEKNDVFDFDPEIPFEGTPNAPKQFLYRSILSPYYDGLGFGGGRGPYKSDKINRISATNLTLTELIALALKEDPITFLKRLDIQSHSPFLSAQDSFISIKRKRQFLFCYDLIVDTSLSVSPYAIMQTELEKVFNLKFSVESRAANCLVLKRTSSRARFRASGDDIDVFFDDQASKRIDRYLHNAPLFYFIQFMQQGKDIPYLLNETGIRDNEKVTVELTAALTDIIGLNKDLEKYDLKIIRAKRKIPFIIIRDRPILRN